MTWNDRGLTLLWSSGALHLDLLTVVAALSLIVGVCLVFAIVLNLRRNAKCRWKRIRGIASAPFTKWQCRDCIMDAFTTDGRPPKECKRALRSNGL